MTSQTPHKAEQLNALIGAYRELVRLIGFTRRSHLFRARFGPRCQVQCYTMCKHWMIGRILERNMHQNERRLTKIQTKSCTLNEMIPTFEKRSIVFTCYAVTFSKSSGNIPNSMSTLESVRPLLLAACRVTFCIILQVSIVAWQQKALRLWSANKPGLRVEIQHRG
jgi:hypothetical protein